MDDTLKGSSGTALDHFASERETAARRAMDHATSEDSLLRSIIAEAQLRGWLVYHARPARTKDGRWVTPMQGDAGFPDLVLVRKPRVLFIEVKSERGKVSPEQWCWVHELDACWPGAEMYVIFPHDRDRISAILEKRA